MKNIRYIDKKDVENLIENKTSDEMMLLFFFRALHRKKHLCQYYEQRILLLSMVLCNIC